MYLCINYLFIYYLFIIYLFVIYLFKVSCLAKSHVPSYLINVPGGKELIATALQKQL